MAGNALTFTITAIDQASSVFNNVAGNVNSSASAGDKWGKTFTVATAAAGVAAVKFGQDSIAAYTESEQSAQRLQDAFDRFPALADSNVASFQKLNTELSKKTRFDDDALASGQAVLAQFGLTGSQIEQMTPLLADYAAKTGKDIPSAAEDLGKATMGQGKALKAIGLDFEDAGSASANLEQLMGGLRTQVSGFAEKDGKTAAGQAAILDNQFGEIQETVGSKLVPILLTLSGVLLKVVDFVSRNSDVIIPLVAGLGGLAAVVYTIITVTRVWTAVQTAFNVVMGLNPAVLITLAIIALVAIIVVAWKHSEQFQAVTTAAFEGVLSVVQGTFGWVRDNWPLLLAILTGPIGLAVLAVVKNWDDIKGGFTLVKDWIGEKWGQVVGFFSDGRDKIAGFFGDMADKITSPFKSAFRLVAQVWNATIAKISFTIPDWVKYTGVGIPFAGKSFDIPDIPVPAFARGGIVRVGDNPSGIEAIIPLERWPEVMGGGPGQQGGGLGQQGGGDVHLHLTVEGFVGNERQLGQVLVNVLKRARESGVIGQRDLVRAFG